MSNETLTQDAAQAALIQQVVVPAFIEKLASRGYPIETQEELEHCLAIATRLEAAQAHESVKSASDRSAFLKEACARLDAVLGQQASDPYAAVGAQLVSQFPKLAEVAAALQSPPATS